jgi:UDP-N-acetylmuramate dehydrogenase
LPNTFGLPSVAARAWIVRDENRLGECAASLDRHDPPPLVLGGASNVILCERVPQPVILMRNRGLRLEPTGHGAALLHVAAGEPWHDVVRFALGQGFGGLENLALIPGSAGAAPIQNIGAYGIEIAECIETVRVFDLRAGRMASWSAADCGFAYRDSRFKRPEAAGLVVTGLVLRLAKDRRVRVDYPDLALELERMGCAHPGPVQVADAVIRIRRRKLPDLRTIGNVGSFFHNPTVTAAAASELRRQLPRLVAHPQADGRVKLAAGQLIDEAGWRGYRAGSVGVWRRQALVLVNHGGATASATLALADSIARGVMDRFGVTLTREPRVVGPDASVG